MKSLDNSLRIILFIAAIILFGFGIYMSLNNNGVNAIATYGAGISCLIFVYLSSFQSFEGLGIKAKLLDQKIEESDAVIKRLQNMLVLIAGMLFSLGARMGRLGSGMPRSDRYHLTEEIEKELLANGVPAEKLEIAKSDLHRFNTIDLYYLIFKDLRKFASEKHQVLRNELGTKLSEKNSPNKILDANKIESKIKSIENLQEKLEALISLREFDSMPVELDKLIDSCLGISDEEKSIIFGRLQEEFSDLRYYSREHKFRRLDIWLNSKNE